MVSHARATIVTKEFIHRRSQRSQRKDPEKPVSITRVIRHDICEIRLGGIPDCCRDPTPPIDPRQLFVIFAAFCADSLLGFTPSGGDRDRRILSQKIAKVSKKGSRKAGFHYLRESSRYLQGQAGRIQDFCRDPTPRIDRLQLFVIFATFCADSFRGFTGSDDDRDRRIHHRRSQSSQRWDSEKPVSIIRVIRHDICEIRLGGIQEFCRDPTRPIDRCQFFVIFAAFCADPLRGSTVSGDDRYGRIHSQKIAKVSKKGSRKAGFHYLRDSSRYLQRQVGRRSGFLS